MTIKKEQIKNRLDRLEGKGVDKKTSRHRDISKSKKTVKTSDREAQVRRRIAQGTTTNYYISKEGELMQRILIHLPFDVAEELRREAFDSMKSLSEVVREKLKP